MARYFASDVHLRPDHPERSARLARWVGGLGPADSLTIVGDLCDFWYVSRERPPGRSDCAGLESLAAFRDRGGALGILPGNHDMWLGDFYRDALGAQLLAEPFDFETGNLRVRLVHGHLVGARRPWKGWMESRLFLQTFRTMPSPLARGLDRLLEHSNEVKRAEDDRRHLAAYRRYTARCAEVADLVVFGHIHDPYDERSAGPRIVVLGGWHHRASYLKIDASGAELIVEREPALAPG